MNKEKATHGEGHMSLTKEQPEEDDAHMEDGDSATTSSADKGDCLSNRPAPSEACPAQDEMLAAEDEARSFFFHEYGRRVGMVPRSSLKEGKNSQMVEKKDKDNPTNKKQPQTTAHRPSLHHLVVFPLC